MTDEALRELYSSAELADVAAVSLGDACYVIAIDHTFEPAGGSGHPAERTAWHFWRREGTTFRKLPDASIPLPTPQAVAVALHGHTLAAVVEANNVTPAWLILWEPGPAIEDMPNGARRQVPLHLEAAQAALVRIPPADDWSTPFLPSTAWVFHASVAIVPETGTIVAVFNTADAHAAVVQCPQGVTEPQPIAFLPDLLEPAFARSGEKNLLFYRKPTPSWSVYFHNLRLSGRFGPVALPLEVAELGGSGGLEQPKRLAVDVFGFSILPGAHGAITLAHVTGSQEKPELVVSVSNGAGTGFETRHSFPLTQIPFRIAMASDKQGILVALGFQGEGGGYHVDTVYLNSDRNA